MEIKFKVKPFLDTLGSVLSVAEGAESVNAEIKDGRLKFSAMSKGNMASALVDASEVDVTDAKGKFAFDPDMMRGLLRGRANIIMKYSKNVLKFKSTTANGKYFGEVVTLPPEDITEDMNAESTKVPKSIMADLKHAVQVTGIENLYTDDPLYILARCRKNSLQVACYDQYHIAFYDKDDVDCKNFSLALPLPTINTIFKVAGDSGFSLSVEENVVQAYNDDFHVSIPLLEVEEEQSIDQVRDHIKTIPKKPTASFDVNVENFDTLLGNMCSLNDQKSAIDMVVDPKDNTIAFSLSSGFGSVKETLAVDAVEVKKKSKFSMSPFIIGDLTDKISTDIVRIGIVKDKYLFFTVGSDELGKAVYMALLL